MSYQPHQNNPASPGPGSASLSPSPLSNPPLQKPALRSLRLFSSITDSVCQFHYPLTEAAPLALQVHFLDRMTWRRAALICSALCSIWQSKWLTFFIQFWSEFQARGFSCLSVEYLLWLLCRHSVNLCWKDFIFLLHSRFLVFLALVRIWARDFLSFRIPLA